MKTLERINIDANQFASHESAPNEMEKYNELYSGYIAGATAENERLQQQIKIANNKINDLQEQLKSSNDKVSELKSAQELIEELEVALVTRDGDLTNKILNKQLKSAQQQLKEYRELIENAFIAGRSKTSWAQFMKDHNLYSK